MELSRLGNPPAAHACAKPRKVSSNSLRDGCVCGAILLLTIFWLQGQNKVNRKKRVVSRRVRSRVSGGRLGVAAVLGVL